MTTHMSPAEHYRAAERYLAEAIEATKPRKPRTTVEAAAVMVSGSQPLPMPHDKLLAAQVHATLATVNPISAEAAS